MKELIPWEQRLAMASFWSKEPKPFSSSAEESSTFFPIGALEEEEEEEEEPDAIFLKVERWEKHKGN